MVRTIQIEITDESYEQLVQLGIVSSHFTKEKPFSPEQLSKAALLQYLTRFSTELPENNSVFLLADLHLLAGEGRLKNRIRSYMKENGIKTKTVMERTGIPKSTLNELLANERPPSLEHLLRLLPALHYPPLTDIFYRDSTAE